MVPATLTAVQTTEDFITNKMSSGFIIKGAIQELQLI
jgi:hypothetical protein